MESEPLIEELTVIRELPPEVQIDV